MIWYVINYKNNTSSLQFDGSKVHYKDDKKKILKYFSELRYNYIIKNIKTILRFILF